MLTKNELQSCIDRCTNSAKMLRNVSNNMINHRGRYALAEADRHIELCITSCLNAKDRVQY